VSIDTVVVEHVIVMVLLTLLIVVAIGIIVLNDLLAAIILSGLYSIISATVFVAMDAVDVAFTEAAVGAGISTIILLGALSFTKRIQKPQEYTNYWALLIVCVTGGALIYGTLDMPRYGDPSSPANSNAQVAQHYLTQSKAEIDVPNVVTSVLASYRSYDTLGETAVVFTAAIGVLSLMGLRRRRRKEDPTVSEKQQRRQQNEETK
jgi:multicomponent Na+:H+ antiporter subunit B